MLALEGYRRRTEEQWDMTRHIMTSIAATIPSEDGGAIHVSDIMRLRRDDENETRPITNMDEAIRLIRGML